MSDPSMGSSEMIALIRRRFEITVHRRSIERALALRSRLAQPSGEGPDPRCLNGFRLDGSRIGQLRQLYEELRAQALGADEPGARPLGRDLFLRRGMAAWTVAMARHLTAFPIAGASDGEAVDLGIRLVDGIAPDLNGDGEFAVMLTNMVLNCRRVGRS
jgi:hypothetical protein